MDKEIKEKNIHKLIALGIAKDYLDKKMISNEEYFKMVKYIKEINDDDKSEDRPK